MRFYSRSPNLFGQVDIFVDNVGISNMARCARRHKGAATGRAAAILAFTAGLLIAALAAQAEGAPVRPQPTAKQAGSDYLRVPPTEKQSAPPFQPDLSASDARYVDELYRELIGPPPATPSGSRSSARFQAAPSDDAAGSVRRWVSAR